VFAVTEQFKSKPIDYEDNQELLQMMGVLRSYLGEGDMNVARLRVKLDAANNNEIDNLNDQLHQQQQQTQAIALVLKQFAGMNGWQPTVTATPKLTGRAAALLLADEAYDADVATLPRTQSRRLRSQ
jgi:hypothetical protein